MKAQSGRIAFPLGRCRSRFGGANRRRRSTISRHPGRRNCARAHLGVRHRGDVVTETEGGGRAVLRMVRLDQQPPVLAARAPPMVLSRKLDSGRAMSGRPAGRSGAAISRPARDHRGSAGPGRSQAEEAMAVPARACHRLGDLRQAAVGLAVRGDALIEDHHTLDPALPLPGEQSPGLQPGPFPRYRNPRFERMIRASDPSVGAARAGNPRMSIKSGLTSR